MAAKKEEKKEEKGLEENLQSLDEIIAKLQDDSISLEDAFAEYSKGVKLVKECNDSIDRVEKKVKLLSDDGTVEDFE